MLIDYIKNPYRVFMLLGDRGLLDWLPDTVYLRLIYRANTGRRLHLKKPVTYNDKLQWYKLYYHDPLMTLCADKYLVRQYVEQQGLSHILTQQYGVYRSADEIVFEDLPAECFLKCNHISAGNVCWNRARDLPRKEEIRAKLAALLKTDYYTVSKEWAYRDIQPRILCEQFLQGHGPHSFVDYNIFCFYGEPRFVMYNEGLCDEQGNHCDGRRAVLDTRFCPTGMTTALEVLPEGAYQRPDNFDMMLDYARRLASPFPHVRVDFFHVNGEIRFGELTFYSGSGLSNYSPDCWETTIGNWFQLPPKWL